MSMGSFPNMEKITGHAAILGEVAGSRMLQERTFQRCLLGNAADEEGINVDRQLPKQGQHLQRHAQLILVRGLGFADPLSQDLQAVVTVREHSEGLARSQLQDLQAEDEV